MTDIKPVHSNIKVRTIVNIMKVNNEHLDKINIAQCKYEYYKSVGDETMAFLASVELKKENDKYSQFLDFYI